jgi:cobalt transport protein ATP-binding subunit
LEADDLWFSYDDGHRALEAVSFSIAAGEFVALIGQNGSGKTTLAKQFIGLLRPAKGRALVDGQDIRDRPVAELARHVGYVFQNPDHQIFSATVRDEIAFGPRNLGLSPAEVAERTSDTLQRFGIAAFAERPPAMLSYGQRRRVSLASTYAMNPHVLILDEPTSGLDWNGVRETMGLVRHLNAAGKTILLITHDMQLVAEFADQCILLHAGRIVAYDDTESLFAREELMRAHGFAMPPVWELSRRLAHCGFSKPAMDVKSFCRIFADLRARRDT